MALRRQKHALSQSTTPFACTLDYPGTVSGLLPAFSWDFLGILFICFPFSPGNLREHTQTIWRPSGQLPCRSVEVKNFSVFLCKRCREISREILVQFSVRRFPGFGCARENFTKISHQKTVWKTENFTHISLCWGTNSFPGQSREVVYVYSEPKMCHKSFLDKKLRGAVRVRV